jgi:hypothetical protein
MCRRIQCEHCQKLTYAGCGKHVEQVLRGVQELDRCQCALLAKQGASSEQRTKLQLPAASAR